MRTRTIAAALGLAGLLTTTAFQTTPENTITAEATRSGDTVVFEGFANLPDPGAFELPEYGITAFSNAAIAEAAGIDLTGARIEELDDASGLRFVWEVSNLPDPVPPEAVRYTWVFEVDGQSYQLQAKSSNLASVTTAEAPEDHLLEAAEGDGWFQLRGACADAYLVEQNPVSGCYHLGFFDGAFDSANGEVVFDLPYEATDRIGRLVAGTFQRGSKLVAGVSANMSVAATFQALVSNTTTAQYMGATWGPYYAGTYVEAALGSAGQAPSSFTALDTDGDGSFAGALTGAGDTLWIRSCRGGVSYEGPDPCITESFAIGS